MGVQLSELLPRKEIQIGDLSNKVLAVDALNALYQFLSIIRQKDGTPLMDNKGRVTSHLSGIFYRGANLIQNNVKLIYVFDGKPPEFKAVTAKKRTKIREEAYEKWQKAKEEGDLEGARKYAQASVKITSEQINEAKELLEAMGIPTIQAPSEGEAQAAYIVSKQDAYAVASSDYDSFLFGAPRLVRNLSITGRRKVPGKALYREITPEIISLNESLSQLKLTQDQLIIIGVLVGTDYNPGGIKGIGPHKALKLVKEYKTLDKIMKNVEWTFTLSAEDIFDFFKNPPVSKEYSIKKCSIDIEKIEKILYDKHNFSKERIENTLNKLKEKKHQSSLGKWV